MFKRMAAVEMGLTDMKSMMEALLRSQGQRGEAKGAFGDCASCKAQGCGREGEDRPGCWTKRARPKHCWSGSCRGVSEEALEEMGEQEVQGGGASRARGH